MPSVQMNTRLDKTLKQQGDFVFAQLGYTPTDVVRMVWQFAAKNAGDPAEVKRQLERLTDEEALEQHRLARQKALDAPERLFRELALQFGIDPSVHRPLPPAFQSPSNAVLRELSFDEERRTKYGLV